MSRLHKPLFFSTRLGQPYACFSNSSLHGFRLLGKRWPTVEHFLLAQMFADLPLADEIRQAQTIMEARRLAQEGGPPPIHREQVRTAWLDKAMVAKFRAHPTLASLLLETGTRTLLEEPPRRLPEGLSPLVSLNHLGFALMRVRTTLRRSAAQKRRPSA